MEEALTSAEFMRIKRQCMELIRPGIRRESVPGEIACQEAALPV